MTWVVGLWLAVGPVYQGQSTTAATTPGVAGESTHYTSTLIEVDGLRVLPLLLIPVALTALALVAVLVSESRQGTRKVALWGLAVLLLGFCVVGIFSIGLFSLAGMPLFAGFATKFILFQVAFNNDFLWLGAMGVTASFVSLYYYLMVIKQIHLYDPEGEDTARFRLPVPMALTLAGLTAGVLLLGLFPAPLFNAIDDSTRMIFAGLI